MPAVFPIKVNFPLRRGIGFANHTKTFGDGHRQTANKNLAFGPRASGLGTLTSHKGLRRFVIRMNALAHVNGSTSATANKLYQFYLDHLGSLTAFYFYDPVETPTIDLTGVNQTGRYLVVFEEDSMDFEVFAKRLMSSGIGLREVRE